MNRSAHARFWEKVELSDEGCWLWTGSVGGGGYGTFNLGGGKYVRAHRFSYQEIRGQIPSGLVLDHLCHVRRCIHPFHLEAVTQKTNYCRAVGGNATKLYCVNGHRFSGDNTVIVKGAERRCRACHRNRERKYNAWKSLTARVFQRDHGVCGICGVDCVAAKKKYDDLCSQFGRSVAREALKDQTGFSPPDSRFWEVDHIVPVSLGGGGCGLDNLRTLCWVCHKEVTAELKGQLARIPKKVRHQRVNQFFSRL